MVVNRSPILRFILAALVIAMPVAMFAAPVGKASGGGSQIEWQLSVSGHEKIVLTVSAPDGEVYSKEFAAGTPVAFSAKDLPALVDGEYTYQLTVVPRIPSGLKEQLAAARNSGDEAGARAIMRKAGIEPISQTGAFVVANGSILSPDRDGIERQGGGAVSNVAREPGAGKEGTSASTAPRPGAPVVNDQVIPDDLIVQGSACVGLDCVNNESFGFDTIRLKENNTRIKFDDTSTSAGCPANDWQLTANDACGGSSKFSIEDITGAKVPFTITAGASTNSIFVDSTGRVGFRTSTPVLDLHVATSNTPAIRLEQNNSGGFTAQTWDVAGNEANFFVRDVTSGSRLPFRIRPGAPTSSIDISASGKVGIGTASPSEALHVFASDDANTLNLTNNTNSTGTAAAAVVQAKADTAQTSMIAHGTGRTLTRFGQTLGGWSEVLNAAGNGLIVGTLGSTPLILGTNSVARLTISNTGAVTIPGNLTVTGTKNFGVPDPADASKAIYFSALEGPEAGTYYRGTAKTVNGEVTITMPGTFTRMTEKERMTVQLTPIGAPGQLYVASRSPEKIVVKTAEGAADIEFDFLVQGVRRGYLDFQVERENDLTIH